MGLEPSFTIACNVVARNGFLEVFENDGCAMAGKRLALMIVATVVRATIPYLLTTLVVVGNALAGLDVSIVHALA